MYNIYVIFEKERSDVKMKVYDKEIYNKQESIKTTVIMIFVFLIGFVAGYLANSFGIANDIKTENTQNEIVELP